MTVNIGVLLDVHRCFKQALIILVGVILHLSPTLACANDTIILKDNLSPYPVSTYMKLLEDKTGTLQIGDIISPAFQSEFRSTSDPIPNAGFTDSVYWAKFQVKGSSGSHEEWILELDYPPVDLVEAYFFENERFLNKSIAGDATPFNEKEIKYTKHAFKFSVNDNQLVTVYVRIKSESAVQFPLTLYRPIDLIEKMGQEKLIAGLYFGILSIIALFNFMLYISMRDQHYLAYVLYISCFGCAQFILMGFAHQYLWPNASWWASHSLIFFFSCSNLFGGIFTKAFLKTSENAPTFDKLINGILVLLGVITLLTLFASYGLAVKVLAVVTAFACPIYLLAAISCNRKGYSPARYFIIAGFTVLAFTVLWIANKFSLVPANTFTEHSMKFGSAIEMILLCLAISDRIRFERRERQKAQRIAVENLKISNDLKSTFISTISHELRTPMNGIIGSLELIDQAKNQYAPIDEHLSTAESSAHRMAGLVDDMLCFADSEANNFKVSQTPFHFKTAMSDIIENYRKLCKTKGLNFDHIYNSGYLRSFVGDAQKIGKVLNHLLDNAVKFTSNGEVILTTKILNEGFPQDNQVAFLIRVSDTGIGIDKKLNEDIYNSFQQADSAFTRRHGGLGIGLALCQNLIKAQEGTISFRSDEQGSCFDVVLFLEKSATSEIVDTNGNEQVIESLDILVVEDDPVNSKILCSILKKLGHRPIKAWNGEKAVETVSKQNVQLVFMDCQMPVMDGYQAADEIRRFNPTLPIVAVSANCEENNRKKCLDTGMNDFIPKPFKKSMIESAINQWGKKKSAVPDIHLAQTLIYEAPLKNE